MKRWTAVALAVLVLWLAASQSLRAETTGSASAGAAREVNNLSWLLLASFLIFFMQAGFALVETGMVRAKNVAHTMAMNVVVFSLGTLGFWACGYAIMFGTGREGYFLSGRDLPPALLGLFLFMSMVVYPVYGRWVWGGGWLSRLGLDYGLGHGHVDYAGSSVVHMVGGGAALAATIFMGPRLGKFRPNGTPNPMPAHNIPMYMVGTLVLAFGWFGFNTGNALAAGDAVCARVAVNTALASAAGGCAALCLTWRLYKKPDPSFLCNGTLAGLVAITAACAYVAPWAAVLIGGVAGLLVIGSAVCLERVARVDDPVGAVSVHGTSGVWGVLALGLFADGTYAPTPYFNGVAGNVSGLFYGNAGQLGAECVGIVANLVWVLPMVFLYFAVAGRLVGNRVSALVEIQGLDVPELGAVGYIPEDPKNPESRGGASQRPAEPRAASLPPVSGKPFALLVEGAEPGDLMRIWSGLCQKTGEPISPDFAAVYHHMTTVLGNRFRFRGGEPEAMRVSMERLFQARLKGQPIHARLEE